MDDLISRQSVIDLVKNSYYNLDISIEDTWEIVADVEKLPSEQLTSAQPEQECEKCIFKPFKQFQPERKKGKWIDKSGGIDGAWNYCSVCGEQAIDLFDFCPNCGADMRGGIDD